MKPEFPLHGLVAAPHTPFHENGALNLAVVERQAGHLLAQGVKLVFVGGTTGEFASLTVAERLALTERWLEVARGTELKVCVHVGCNCLEEARALAADAQRRGAISVGCVAPHYFKPGCVDDLVGWCAAVAVAAPETPFYYYEIPALTGVHLPVAEFAEKAAGCIPNFTGLKYTAGDLMVYQHCLRAAGGTLDVAWGRDEWLLAALALGARGAVGSTYNFAARLYDRLMRAFAAGDWETAREEQYRSVRMVELLARYGFLPASKVVMKMAGVDVGPPRPPLRRLTGTEEQTLKGELERLGFWDWVR